MRIQSKTALFYSIDPPGRKGARDLAGRPLMSQYSADSRAIPCDPVSLRVIARLQRTTQISVIA